MQLDRDTCYRALLTRDARFDGRFFTAVRSTGIYCRPICPAKTPRLQNVEFMATAAAAQEAGFRPCLRCRPETSPDLAAWHGTAACVGRAMRLIEAGALNQASVAALAERVGLGERQLRRLFDRHVGASPLAVAQTRRVHLARRLIAETGLSMTDIALASGFGSLRRFNDCFQRMFGRAPGSLRRRPADARAAGAPIELRLPYRPPFDWPALAAYLARRAVPGVEAVNANSYRRSIELDGRQGQVEVGPSGDEPALRARIWFPDVSALPRIVERLRRMFDLAADPVQINAQLSADPLLGPLVERRPGLRVPGAWDGFELAVRAVLGQQVTVASATAQAARVAQAFGRSLEVAVADDDADRGDGGIVRCFPTPQDLLAGNSGFDWAMPQSRVRTLLALAQAATENPNLFDGTLGLDDAVQKLCRVPGIGPWTAHYIALRALREPDAFPPGDVALLRVLAGAGARPGLAAVDQRSQAWRPWRSYAAIHLWQSESEAGPAAGTTGVAP